MNVIKYFNTVIHSQDTGSYTSLININAKTMSLQNTTLKTIMFSYTILKHYVV